MEQYITQENMTALINTSAEFGFNLISALAILIVGLWVAKKIAGWGGASVKRSGVDETLTSFLSKLIHAGLAAFVIIAALSRVGIQTASFVAVLAAAGLAVGLALQGSLANFAAGVLIMLFRPYKLGDWVEAGGVSGSVKDISIFSTVLATGDNKKIIVPNSQMTGGSITNYSAYDTRRVDLVVGVSYSADLQKARSVFEKVIREQEAVLEDKDITVAVKALGASSVDFVLRAWVKSGDYWPTYFALTEKIKLALDEHGIGIPFPQMDVHLNPSVERALAQRQGAAVVEEA